MSNHSITEREVDEIEQVLCECIIENIEERLNPKCSLSITNVTYTPDQWAAALEVANLAAKIGGDAVAEKKPGLPQWAALATITRGVSDAVGIAMLRYGYFTENKGRRAWGLTEVKKVCDKLSEPTMVLPLLKQSTSNISAGRRG